MKPIRILNRTKNNSNKSEDSKYKQQLEDYKIKIEMELANLNKNNNTKLEITRYVTFNYTNIDFDKSYIIQKEYIAETNDDPFTLEYKYFTYIIDLSSIPTNHIKPISDNHKLIKLTFKDTTNNKTKQLLISYGQDNETEQGTILGSRY